MAASTSTLQPPAGPRAAVDRLAAALESHDYFLNTIEVRSRRLEHSSRSHVLSNCMCVACNHAMAGESTCGAVHRGYVAELCAQAHAELLHRGRVAAAAALSAAEGSGSRRSAVYVGFRSVHVPCVVGARCVFSRKPANRTAKSPKIFRLARRARGALRRLARLRRAGCISFSDIGSKCFTYSEHHSRRRRRPAIVAQLPPAGPIRKWPPFSGALHVRHVFGTPRGDAPHGPLHCECVAAPPEK